MADRVAKYEFRYAAFLVGAGILLSRIAGLIRDRVFAHYFGNSAAADAFRAAFRIPNFLQNLFGEGTLSASFIPVYAGLLSQQKEEEASRVAGAIAALLALITSLLVLAGVLLTPYFIDLIVPGFEGEKRALTIRLVKILFPGTGILVLSAWCLGILNSHHRFFLSYAAPVLWNIVMIGVLAGFGSRLTQYPLAEALAWGAVVGSMLQLGLQLPSVLHLAKPFSASLHGTLPHVRLIIRNFFPAFLSRGVVQISAYIDAFIASLLPTGAVAALSYAQTLYLLPFSLFGMSISAAELPVMARARGTEQEVALYLQKRLVNGLRQVAFFIVPSAIAFLTLGDVIIAAIYQTGEFSPEDTLYVWSILAASSIGLLASTLSRLYISTYYALLDTRTPLAYASIRVLLTTMLGYSLAIYLPPLLGIEARWGIIGLTLSSGSAGWLEFVLLRHTLNQRIGQTGLPFTFALQLCGAAGTGSVVGWGLKFFVGTLHPVLLAGLLLSSYGIVYMVLTYSWGFPEAQAVIERGGRFLGWNRSSAQNSP